MFYKYDKQIVIYDEYDVTQLINNYISYNCELLLTNKNKIYKKFLIYLLNNILKDKNIIIKDNYDIKWKIITNNIQIIENTEIQININNGLLIIKENK